MATIHSIEDCPPLPETDGVEIRHVPGFLGYAISNDGRLWSCRPYNKQKKETLVWRTLKASMGGYKLVRFRRNGAYYTRTVPRLVAETFIGPCPADMEVCHNDGDKTNDTVSNLRWDTHQANIQDSIRHGTFAGLKRGGEAHPQAKLTLQDVQQIRTLVIYCTHKELADIFGVDRSTISKIISRCQWTHV